MTRGGHGSGRGGSRRQTALLILAMLCVRAFIPAGFMAAPVDGRWQLVVCGPGALGSAGHTQHDPGHQHQHDDPNCPFALSAAPGPLPSLPALAAVQNAAVLALPTGAAQPYPSFEPARQHLPRGPPRLIVASERCV